MQTPLVMTLIGRDRPGLVERVAHLVASHGGNWLESRMSRLGGKFAGILRFTLPAESETPFLAAVRALDPADLAVVVHPDHDAPPAAGQRLVVVELLGQDRPGIVRQITAAFARRGVNVEELTSGCESAPMSGESLFRAHLRLSVPGDCRLDDLRADLERLAADLMVDLAFHEVKTAGQPG